MKSSWNELRDELLEARSLLGTIDWRDPVFAPDKAYISSVFAKFAYCYLPQAELAGKGGVKIIPCLTHQAMVRSGGMASFSNLAGSAELGDPFVIVTDYVVVVGLIFQNVVFLALRGTRLLYLRDWLIDLEATFQPVQLSQQTIQFHRGFFNEIAPKFGEISETLRRRIGHAEIPVYVVGHSLGGAMAAIFHTLSGTSMRSASAGPSVAIHPTHSCYTFGMPRYGDKDAVHSGVKNSEHTLNSLDVVPELPPPWIGFATLSPSRERYLTGDGILRQGRPSRSFTTQALARLMAGRGVRHHFMERYVERLKTVAFPTRP